MIDFLLNHFLDIAVLDHEGLSLNRHSSLSHFLGRHRSKLHLFLLRNHQQVVLVLELGLPESTRDLDAAIGIVILREQCRVCSSYVNSSEA